MANLTAVLRKTIDGLPNPTPQVRAKVYEKARAAIARQIEAANPPLDEGVVEARRRALEDAIVEAEAFYLEDVPPAAPTVPAAETAAVSPAPELRSSWNPKRSTDAGAPPNVAGPSEERVGEIGPAEPRSDREARPVEVATPPAASRDAADRSSSGLFPSSPAQEAEPRDDSRLSDIPEADMQGPRYRDARGWRRMPLAAGIAVLALVGAAGGAGYVYQDEIRARLTGASQTAGPVAVEGTDAGESTTTAALEAPGPTPAAPSGPAVEEAPAAAAAPSATPPVTGTAPAGRRFTQRLLPDGTEVDEGPGTGTANAFDEGTDVATASLNVPAATPPEAAVIAGAAASQAGTETAALPPAGEPGAVPVAQKAIFYEERSGTEAGTQQGGNVVWSVVNEPPADGQPPEPAIRAVAEVPDEDLRMTMTIRRNADTTLPASHVIELMFDVPQSFSGGGIENVQRLALKPTEQARGEPLIGVAGKISDGFFIIALNDLQQAIQSNLDLMGSEQWIDIPLAYTTGQRALMSIEKGIPGERVFKEAMDAWAART